MTTVLCFTLAVTTSFLVLAALAFHSLFVQAALPDFRQLQEDTRAPEEGLDGRRCHVMSDWNIAV